MQKSCKTSKMAKLQQTIGGHTSDVNGLSFSHDVLASCSSDRSVRLWSLNDFTELPCSPLLKHTYPVHSCVFSPDFGLLATCSTDGKCILWLGASDNIESSLSHPSGKSIRACAFSPDGQLLATGCDDNYIGIWHVASKKLLKLLTGSTSTPVTLTFSPDTGFLVSGGIDGHIYFWDAQFGHGLALTMVRELHDLGVTCVKFSPTYGTAGPGKLPVGEPSLFQLATGGFDNLLKLWDFSATLGNTDVKVLARATLKGHGEPVLCCDYSPDGAHLVSGSNDHTIRVWDAFRGEEVACIEAHARYVTSVAYSPCSRFIASASNDKTIKVWIANYIGANHNKQSQNRKVQSNIQTAPDSTPTGAEGGSPIFALRPAAPELWSVNDVCQFVAEIGLSEYSDRFRSNAIDGTELLALTQENLQSALKIDALGHRNKILRAMEQIEKHPMKHHKSAQSASREDRAPDEFYCPITMEIMKDPVIACDGYTYERRAIEAWIKSGKTNSPMTNATLANHNLTPNRSLKLIIQKHLQTAK